MEVKSITKNVRMSPQKMREVTRQIAGMNALQAQSVLNAVTRKSARLISKTLNSAIANAEHQATEKADLHRGFEVEKLRIKEAVVGEASTMKRFIPKARGSAGPIHKRSSHIRIILSDEN